jgi:hypothetical protein
MRLAAVVPTLVFSLQSDISLQICPSFCAESIELISIEMGSVDASRSCASNPGRRFGIGRLIVEVCIVLYVARTTFVVGHFTLQFPMCA